MENHFNTPAEVVDLSIKACENKTKLPVGKMILLGIMAGVFIALGGATSSTAAHAVENVGVARALAGVIFPVGLMLIVFLGGELFTGNCLIIIWCKSHRCINTLPIQNRRNTSTISQMTNNNSRTFWFPKHFNDLF